MIAAVLAFLHPYRRAVGVSVALVACGGVMWAVVHRYNEQQVEKGRVEVRAQQLDSLLHVERARTARVDTLREVAVKRFTQTVTQWKTDTVRLEILSLPDTSLIPVSKYRTLSTALDSVVSAAGVALSAADSLAMQERREKLLWRAKAETQTPTIVYPPPEKWEQRGKGFLGGLLVAGIAFVVTR